MPGRAAGSRRVSELAIIVSRYNARVTSRLLEGAVRAARASASARRLDVFDAPGAFDLPPLALAAARTGRYAGVLALGCIVRGQTVHDRVIAEAVAYGLTRASLDTGVPIALGVLTVNTPAQAMARSGGNKGNKGEEAMTALIESISTMNAIRAGRSTPARRSARPDKTRRRRA